MADFAHPYFETVAAVGPRSGVWQITPPQDYRDRMAEQGAPATPAGGYPLTDHGGSTIKSPKLAIVYLGPWWGDVAKVEQFAKEIMEYGYLAPLSAYGSGVGKYLGSWHGPAVSGTVTDAQLQAALQEMIDAPPAGFPLPDGDTLYALFLPDGVTVTTGAGPSNASCSGFCGYHDALADGRTFYSVHPSTTCSGCNSDVPINGFQMCLGHEIAEACSDAVPGKGWFNDATGMENADEFAWIERQYGPWTVQGYQVNGVGNDFGPYTVPATPQPGPQPGPTPQPSTFVAAMDAEFKREIAVVAAEPAIAGHPDWWRAMMAGIQWAQAQQDAVAASELSTSGGVTPFRPLPRP